MPYFMKRLAEVFLLSIICSVPVMMLNTAHIASSRIYSFILASIAAAVFLIVNFVLLRAYISGVDSRAAYCRVNGTAMGLYILISAFLIYIKNGAVLAWAFMPVKFLEAAGFSTKDSALIFYILMAVEFFVVLVDYSLAKRRIRYF